MHAPQLAAKWSAHGHVSGGRGHRVIGFLQPEEKVIVGIRCHGEEVLFTIPWKGTVYNNVDVRRRVLPTLG
jgi:hypothetical protein